jgi:hypothetical protein
MQHIIQKDVAKSQISFDFDRGQPLFNAPEIDVNLQACPRKLKSKERGWTQRKRWRDTATEEFSFIKMELVTQKDSKEIEKPSASKTVILTGCKFPDDFPPHYFYPEASLRRGW